MSSDVVDFMGVMTVIAGFIGAMTFVRVMARRYGVSRGHRLASGELEELQYLRDRIELLEDEASRVTELEERLDFAERMLTEIRDRPMVEPVAPDTPA